MRIDGAKNLLVFVMVLAWFFVAESSYAAKICLQDNVDGFWELKGGKIDKKTYTAKYFNGLCVIGGHADATLTNSGSIVVGLFNSHGDLPAQCPSISWSATTDTDFAGSGEYDISGDGTIDGTFTLTRVSCSSLPPSKPEKE